MTPNTLQHASQDKGRESLMTGGGGVSWFRISLQLSLRMSEATKKKQHNIPVTLDAVVVFNPKCKRLMSTKMPTDVSCYSVEKEYVKSEHELCTKICELAGPYNRCCNLKYQYFHELFGNKTRARNGSSYTSE